MSQRHLFLLIGIPLAVLILVVVVMLSGLPGTNFPSPLTQTLIDKEEAFPEETFEGEASLGIGAFPDERSLGAPEFVGDTVIFPPEPPTTGGKTAAEVDQKIIKNGYLDLTVDDVSETVSKIRTLATGKGGFEQASSVSEREDGAHYGDITVRVPAVEFEGVMNEIKTYAKVVTTETASGQDVTEQYTDLKARLRNAEAQETEYLNILKKAQTVKEILMVQPYLSSVRAEIESLKGQIQYFENLTAYSTISVSLSEEPTVRVPTKEFRPIAIVKEAFQALVAVVQALAEVIIWLAIIGGPIVIVAVIFVWVVVKIFKRWTK